MNNKNSIQLRNLFELERNINKFIEVDFNLLSFDTILHILCHTMEGQKINLKEELLLKRFFALTHFYYVEGESAYDLRKRWEKHKKSSVYNKMKEKYSFYDYFNLRVLRVKHISQFWKRVPLEEIKKTLSKHYNVENNDELEKSVDEIANKNFSQLKKTDALLFENKETKKFYKILSNEWVDTSCKNASNDSFFGDSIETLLSDYNEKISKPAFPDFSKLEIPLCDNTIDRIPTIENLERKKVESTSYLTHQKQSNLLKLVKKKEEMFKNESTKQVRLKEIENLPEFERDDFLHAYLNDDAPIQNLALISQEKKFKKGNFSLPLEMKKSIIEKAKNGIYNIQEILELNYKSNKYFSFDKKNIANFFINGLEVLKKNSLVSQGTFDGRLLTGNFCYVVIGIEDKELLQKGAHPIKCDNLGSFNNNGKKPKSHSLEGVNIKWLQTQFDHKQTKNLKRIFYFCEEKDCLLVQYIFLNGFHGLNLKPHGNSRKKKNFFRINSLYRKKIKEDTKMEKPRMAYNTAMSKVDSLKVNPSELPSMNLIKNIRKETIKDEKKKLNSYYGLKEEESLLGRLIKLSKKKRICFFSFIFK